MDSKDIIGLCIFVGSLILTILLIRLRFSRRNPMLMAAFMLNPGMVGFLAGLAFWLRDQSYSLYIWIAAMVLMAPAIFLVIMTIGAATKQDLAPPGPEQETPPAEEESPPK